MDDKAQKGSRLKSVNAVQNVTSLKDKISFVISIIALVLSAVTFGITRWESYQENHKKIASETYAAFQLGKGFSIAYLVYVHTREGDPNKVEAAKQEALAFANQKQAYADALDLRMEIQALIKNYKYKDAIIPETPFSMVETRLRNNHSEAVVSTFTAAWWLAWLNFNTQATYEVNPGFLPTLKEGYPKVASIINSSLSALGINKRISQSLPSLEVAKTETLDALNELERKVSGHGG